MLRIAVISQLPPPIHGSTVMTRTLVQVLEKSGHTWSIVDRRFSTSVAEVGAFKFRKVLSAGWMLCRLLTTLVQFRPQVVIFFATNRTWSFVIDWMMSEILRAFSARKILYLHTVGYQALANRGWLWAWLTKRLLGAGDTIVTLGPSLASDITRWVDPTHIMYVPNTVSDTRQHTSNYKPDKPPIILYFSNLIPEKGADVFVECTIDLVGELPNARFILAGATVDEKFSDSLMSKMAGSSASSHFELTGAVTDVEQKWTLLSEAAVLAFPSTYPFEAQPLTILEALSVGTPVVAFDVGGLRDIVRHGIDGYLVPAGDRQAFKAALLSFVTDRSEGRYLPDEVTSSYEERFSPTAYAQHWTQILELDR